MQLLEIVQALFVEIQELERDADGITGIELAQIAQMDFGGEAGVLAFLQIGQAAAKQLVDFVDGAVEQHIVIGHVEMAVVVDPAGLDPHRRGDEGREKGGFGHLFEILAVEHGETVADFGCRRQEPELR